MITPPKEYEVIQMDTQVAGIPADTVREIVHSLNTRGFGCIPNYLPEDELKRIRSFVIAAVRKNSGEYVDFKGLRALSGSGLDELAVCPQFKKLLFDVYESGTGREPIQQEFYSVLRCLAGQKGQDNSLKFHYDSYVVTALIPIEIPSEGRPGDLLMYPNTRPLRSSYIISAIDKILLDNQLRQKLLRVRIGSKLFGPTRIKMEPGNLYLFWGYRSIHANEPCDPDKIRATALFHYMNPHAEDFVLRDRWLKRLKPGNQQLNASVQTRSDSAKT